MKLLIIGGGGIGSWLVSRISRLKRFNQLNYFSEIVIVDYDEIENKNLPYQNFEVDEVMDSKALTLEDKFEIAGKNLEIKTEKDLKFYDVIICAVDNAMTRRLIYKHCITNKKFFIDLRAEGSTVWGITSDSNWSLEQLEAT